MLPPPPYGPVNKRILSPLRPLITSTDATAKAECAVPSLCRFMQLKHAPPPCFDGPVPELSSQTATRSGVDAFDARVWTTEERLDRAFQHIYTASLR